MLEIDRKLSAGFEESEVKLREGIHQSAEHEIDHVGAILEGLGNNPSSGGAVRSKHREPLLSDPGTGETADVNDDASDAKPPHFVVKVPPVRVGYVDTVPIGGHEKREHP